MPVQWKLSSLPWEGAVKKKKKIHEHCVITASSALSETTSPKNPQNKTVRAVMGAGRMVGGLTAGIITACVYMHREFPSSPSYSRSQRAYIIIVNSVS